jgi:hypothetical protein
VPRNKRYTPILREAMTFASFEPGIYEVVETWDPGGRP